MNIFKKELAPITDEAWSEIEKQAQETLKANLIGRRLVNLEGPYGLNHSAVGLGRLTPVDLDQDSNLYCGIQQVLPLLEIKAHFQLDHQELDHISRGAKDANLDALIQAAKKIAAFEDSAIFKGFTSGHIRGMEQAATLATTKLPDKAVDFIVGLSDCILKLQTDTIEGSLTDAYSLVVSTQLFQFLASHFVGSHSLVEQIEILIKGKIYHSRVIDKSFLMMNRPDFFELTLGQDLTIGYQGHDADSVTLYLMETFTFRVLNPQAYMILE